MSERQRFAFLDVARGIAVLWMVQVHITNPFIHPALRETPTFHALNITNGFVAPMFILCAGAGFWIALSRRLDAYLRGGPQLVDYVRRLAYILFWAFVLHLPFLTLDRMLIATPEELLPGLQMDVLHTIVLTSALALGVTFLVRTLDRIAWVFAAFAVAILLVSPSVWAASPDRQHWNWPWLLVSPPSLFPLLPWSLYFFVGALFARWFFGVRDQRRASWLLVAQAVVVIPMVYLLHDVPDAKSWQDFWWQCSPHILLFRVSGTLMVLGLLYLLVEGHRQHGTITRFLQLVGKESLLMYVGHLLVLYGAGGTVLRMVTGITTMGYGGIALLWLTLMPPLLLLMWWWHAFKQRHPEHARRLLALEVGLIVIAVIARPASWTILP